MTGYKKVNMKAIKIVLKDSKKQKTYKLAWMPKPIAKCCQTAQHNVRHIFSYLITKCRKVL